jgi:hypothetical protein
MREQRIETGSGAMRVTAHNWIGKTVRIVASYLLDTTDVREALQEAQYRSLLWNRDETRDELRVTLVGVGVLVRAI